MKRIETKMGTLYYERAEDELKFYDSDKNFLIKAWKEEEKDANEFIQRIIECDDVYDLFTTIFSEYVCFAQSLEELLQVINDTIESENEIYLYQDELMTMEDLKGNDYLNRIGNNYVFFMNY